MKIGILGLPGSGKSTLFNLLTESPQGSDHGLPPNKSRMKTIKVRDARLERLRDDYQPKKYTPAGLELLDFPAFSGREEDRAGLADLLLPAREVDALLLVLRDFNNPALGEAVDPARDLNEIRAELILSDLVSAERRLEKLADKSRKPSYTDDDKRERALLERVKAHLEGEKSVSEMELGPEESKRLGGFCFLSGKPFVVVLSGESAETSGERLQELRESSGVEVLPVAARNELDILALPEADRQVFLAEFDIKEFQRDAIIQAAYRAAGLISFLTAGEKEVRAWTIKAGSTAPQAAGAIHTDFERGFIRAEVVSYDDYLEYGGIKGAKEKGHYRLEGREYIIQDGDIIEFRFSV
jgi:hypothetical protein